MENNNDTEEIEVKNLEKPELLELDKLENMDISLNSNELDDISIDASLEDIAETKPAASPMEQALEKEVLSLDDDLSGGNVEDSEPLEKAFQENDSAAAVITTDEKTDEANLLQEDIAAMEEPGAENPAEETLPEPAESSALTKNTETSPSPAFEEDSSLELGENIEQDISEEANDSSMPLAGEGIEKNISSSVMDSADAEELEDHAPLFEKDEEKVYLSSNELDNILGSLNNKASKKDGSFQLEHVLLHSKAFVSLFKHLDKLLSSLPQEGIDAFAKSADFAVYSKIIQALNQAEAADDEPHA